MDNSINILNGTLVLPEGCRRGSIGINGGKIEQIVERPCALSPAKKNIDATGRLIFPGVIDSHVHIRGGIFSYREDFTSGTMAAVAAGITTLFEMPGCAKPASTLENFLSRVDEVTRDACIDVALYGGAGADNLDEIPRLAAAGAIGFKTFLMPPVVGREKEFYGLCSASSGDLEKVMACIAETGLTLTIHCEEGSIIADKTKQIRAKDGNRVRDFCASRPEEAEARAVARAICAAKATGCRTIVAHVSSAESMKMICQAQEKGLDIHAETCVNYLTFDSDSMDEYGGFARMKPPFRIRNCVDQLVQGYSEGKIELTGSDHAPFTREEKCKSGNSIWQAPDGLPGLELTLLLLLRLVEQHKLTYEMIAQNTAENTAQLFGLDKIKGRIARGRDADLVIVKKLRTPEYINHQNLRCKCRESAIIYDDLTVSHQVVSTIARGRIAYSNEQVLLQAGQGRFLSSK
ncbi:MAG: amidohydrolase [Firmicutes bacterium]|nr:amidohydrolase [Bacillota bacterium]